MKIKKSLIASIAIILIVGFGGYYLLQLKQAPYPVASFVSISYKWGVGDTLANAYDSQTGIYRYLDRNDSLRIGNVKLNTNSLIYLHNKANEAGLWELPDVVDLKGEGNVDSVLRYEMVFTYEQKTKKISFYANSLDAQLQDKISKLQQIVAQTIQEAEERNPTFK
ncbi:MAG: hypothetical protein REI78_00765 [Pedobacter sp.]|nr:hypothetical protein [Pedobacter sp.]MDQ8051518.1 hypothetical protein [Pedobacter sp.]